MTQDVKRNERTTNEQANAVMRDGLERFMSNVKGMRGVATHVFVSEYMPRNFGFGVLSWARLSEVAREMGLTVERNISNGRMTVRRGVGHSITAKGVSVGTAAKRFSYQRNRSC